MAFPTGVSVSESNLDSGTDDPSLARADLLLAVQSLNTIIDGAGAASGVALLDAGGKITASQIPSTLSPSAGVMTLSPTSGVVKIQDVLRLQILDVASITALTGTEGDIVYVQDGNANTACLAVYNGTAWKRLTWTNTVSTTLDDVINLVPQTVAELTALTAAEGDIAYCSNGAGGSKCVAVYNGTSWLRVTLGSAISAT
jgi:hypothetical protein